jgi:ATP synthase protein I
VDERRREDPVEETGDDHRDEVLRSVGRKASRKARAREEGDHVLSFGLGTFGLVGWSVMIPTVLGIAAGVWLDARDPGRISWTLTGLLAGVLAGAFNAWYWVSRKSRGE